MTPPEQQGREAWTHVSFALAGALVLVLAVLGSRPGGSLAPLLYSRGLLGLGLAAALVLTVGLLHCVLRKPALQRGRLGGLLCALAVLWAASYPLAYPSSHAGRPSAVVFRLPFGVEGGPWTVRQAGERRTDNVLVLDPARRFGLVLVPDTESSVLAPAAGEVLVVGEGTLALAVAPAETLVITGLVATSVVPGERVAEGQDLGASGVDGITLHLQDRPEPGKGEGIPLRFHDYLADGRAVSSGVPLRGQRVRPSAESRIPQSPADR